MLFVVLGWVLFRAENSTGAVKYVLAMFGIGASGLLDAKAAYYMAEYKLFFLLAIAASLPIAGWLGRPRNIWMVRLACYTRFGSLGCMQ